MKAILRKGMAACAALLMGANVMAQENVFVENAGVQWNTDNYFIPGELCSDGTPRLIMTLDEDLSPDSKVNTGFVIMNKNLEIEKELKLYEADKIYNTSFEIYEVLDENGDWVETRRNSSRLSLPYIIYRSENSNYTSIATVTQTLFNDDDKYEMIVPVYDGEIISYKEGSNSRTVYKDYFVSTLNIVNESGEVLHTLAAGENKFFMVGTAPYHQINRIEDKTYLVISGGYADNEGIHRPTYRWYEICKETNSINFVRETRAAMNIAPTIANRDAQITITLNEENSNVTRELVVTGVNGQLVERRDIPAGENSVQIPASMLRSGMYNFTLQQKGQVVDNGKVIVK